MFIDMLNEIKEVESIIPAAQTATKSGDQVINASGYKYVTHKIVIGTITTLNGTNFFTASITEADAATNATTLTSPQSLPTANVLGVEYVTGGTFSTNAPKTTDVYPEVLNSSTNYAAGTICRIVTLKNKNYQLLTLTATLSPSVIIGATAELSGATYTPAT